jgi:hypothetical protein
MTGIEARMKTLLSEADSGAMGMGERLAAAKALLAEAWQEGVYARDRTSHGGAEPTNPYREA